MRAEPLGAAPGLGAGPARILASVGRLHIVAIATLGTLTFGLAFTGERPWLAAVVTGVDWFLVNLLNRTVDVDEDLANGIPGTGLVARHRRAIVVAGAASLVASLVVGHALAAALTPLRVGYHLLGLAYNWPLLPGVGRLKQRYFWKNTASAAGFLLTCFGYPLALAGGRSAADVTVVTVALTGAFFFLFELSYEVLYDLRDVEGDRLAGVRTYPAVHGPAAGARIAEGLALAALALLAAGYAAGLVPWRIAVMAAAPATQLVLVRRRATRGLDAGDCVALTWLGAGLLALYHLWIAAGLPGARGEPW